MDDFLEILLEESTDEVNSQSFSWKNSLSNFWKCSGGVPGVILEQIPGGSSTWIFVVTSGTILRASSGIKIEGASGRVYELDH